MSGFIKRIAARLARDERGTSLLEFAFVAPVLGLLVVGVGDVGRGLSERFALQQAVNRTIELAHLENKQANYNFLIAEAAAAAGVPEANVTLTSWLECNGVTKAYTATCTSGEQIARYITLKVDSSFRPSFGTLGWPGATGGTVPLSARASLRVQ